MAGKGRPRVQIDESQFEKLCQLQCTAVEIAGFFGCSHDTIERWCKRRYGAPFNEVFETYSVGGKISLRRIQFKLAEKHPVMAIFLGKQILGQKDRDEMKINEKIEIVSDVPKADTSNKATAKPSKKKEGEN